MSEQNESIFTERLTEVANELDSFCTTDAAGKIFKTIDDFKIKATEIRQRLLSVDGEAADNLIAELSRFLETVSDLSLERKALMLVHCRARVLEGALRKAAKELKSE